MKRFISLLLVFSILALSVPLLAKERKGADLIIQKADGTQVRGELIAVKQNSLLLMERESGADVTVEIVDTQSITIKKYDVLMLSAIGLMVGVVVGYLIGDSLENKDPEKIDIMEGLSTLVGAIAGGVLGLGAGVVAGSSIKVDETIQLEGKSDAEIQEILEKLRKKARIRNSQ